jgi:inward rectifier potassium channel
MAKKTQSKELGFGSMTSEKGQRFINPDGTANVSRLGDGRLSASDILHNLTVMPWPKFFLVIFINYIVANLFFATLYYFSGVEHLGMQPSGSPFKDFLEAFFFSTQAFTTIGFGRVNPQGTISNILASIEGLTGLLSFALASGLMYGRFSRPRAHLIHSKNIIVAPYKENMRALMFRVASKRQHSLLKENQISVSLGLNLMENGELKRRFYILDLELSKINFLTMSWTVVHPIVTGSPLFGLSEQEIMHSRMEVIILFRAIEETNSQTVFEKFSYFVDELVWGAKFLPVFGTNEEGQVVMNLDLLSSINPSPLPSELKEGEYLIDEVTDSTSQAST